MKSVIFVIILILNLNILYGQDQLPREFRGVWVATVGNIDWPSAKNLNAGQQKKEIINLLDLFKTMNFNAVIFQIRPSADAFYNSKYEPWSFYLNGSNNKAPTPYYDPLAFIIEEAHKRGMELHAWLNPYRAVVNYQEFRSNPFPLTYEKPEWFINYGKNKYFDPGLPEVRAYTKKVVTDIVQNYDVDAIHFDDYFYPYKIKGEDFDDESSFKAYGGELYPDHRDQWRRRNVNLVIGELYNTIKDIKPWVQLGISPFGVWRNLSDDKRGSATKAGQTNYDDLYADTLYWIKKGWMDYIVPQAYWRIGHEKVGYEEIVKWWAANSFGTTLYIGHGMYRLGNKTEDPAWNQQHPTQIERQLDVDSSIDRIRGSVFFSARSFTGDPLKIREALVNGYYRTPVLQPIVNKNIKYAPQPVLNPSLVKLKNKQYELSWDLMPEKTEYKAVKFLVYLFEKNETQNIYKTANIIRLTGETSIVIPKKSIQDGQTLYIVAVSRNNNLSSPVSLKL